MSTTFYFYFDLEYNFSEPRDLLLLGFITILSLHLADYFYHTFLHQICLASSPYDNLDHIADDTKILQLLQRLFYFYFDLNEYNFFEPRDLLQFCTIQGFSELTGLNCHFWEFIAALYCAHPRHSATPFSVSKEQLLSIQLLIQFTQFTQFTQFILCSLLVIEQLFHFLI